MPKTTLDLDALEVASFATSPEGVGFPVGGDESWSWTIYPCTRSCA